MINRGTFLQEIKLHKDTAPVKVVAGIRHSGKSSLFLQFSEYLKASGISDDHILYLNFETAVFSDIKTAVDIEKFVKTKTKHKGKYYVILDEVQRIKGWENIVRSLCAIKKLDIYIAVSSGTLFSKKKESKNANKIVLINCKPLSFAEFKNNNKPVFLKGTGLLKRAIAIRKAYREQFNNYVEQGGFPAVLLESSGAKQSRIKDIYSSIIFRDVVERNNIRNIELLERIIKYIFKNLGREISVKKITEHLEEINYKKNLSLINHYVQCLENAFVVKRISRYNIASGKILRTNIKYFIEDHSLLNAVADVHGNDIQGIYENILLNDLQRRSFRVWTGKMENELIDFIAVKNDKIVFVQVINNQDASVTYNDVLQEKIEVFDKLLNNIDTYIEYKERTFYIVNADTPSILTREDNKINIISVQNFLLLENI
ncbi:MAG: ATP-binding protein [Spirochaetaceae bacterium]|jgi:predicted AAA+ superfamily ATPase|nr:ATP-binding protein [Spirochaetaceae bacterium]